MSLIIKLKWFIKQRWIHYLIGVSLLIIANLAFLIPPRFIGKTIDQIRSETFTADKLSNSVILLATLSCSLYVIIFFYHYLLFGNAIQLEKLLKGRLMRHLTQMTPSFFQRNRTGELMALVNNDIPFIANIAGGGVMTLVFTFIGTVIVFVAMIVYVDYKLMLASLLPLPLLAYTVSKLGVVVRRRFKDVQEAFGHMNQHVIESISGLRVLRSYVQERKDIEAFERVTDDVMKKNMKAAFTNTLIQPVIMTVVGFSYVIGNGYGSYLVFHNQITLGQLITFNMFLGLIIWPMVYFGEFVNMLKQGSASLERLEQSMEQQPDVVDANELVPVSVPTSIEMKQLTFRYPGASSDSLRNVSFRIEQGQTLGIVGRTGSGKSTLLKQLLRQYIIEPQRLFISDVPIEQVALDRVRSWIGYVPQDHLLLSKSIRDNIAMGNPEATDDEVLRAIELSCLKEDIEQMSEGWDTIIGESGIMLSGGQKQRMAIARALLINPEILILDDVLSAVDAKTESLILKNIRQQTAGRTTFITAHRLSAVSHAHWIVVLDQGQIIEEGTHEQLLYRNGWYKEQYERQQMEALSEGKEAL